jgi:hypothetical protein
MSGAKLPDEELSRDELQARPNASCNDQAAGKADRGTIREVEGKESHRATRRILFAES